MAHSLRSKPKLRAKSIKRGNEFQKAVDERTQRLHEKAKQELLKQKSKKEELKEQEDKIEVDAENEQSKPTVSTSGYRTARHHLYKKKHKKSSIVFRKRK